MPGWNYDCTNIVKAMKIDKETPAMMQLARDMVHTCMRPENRKDIMKDDTPETKSKCLLATGKLFKNRKKKFSDPAWRPLAKCVLIWRLVDEEPELPYYKFSPHPLCNMTAAMKHCLK